VRLAHGRLTRRLPRAEAGTADVRVARLDHGDGTVEGYVVQPALVTRWDEPTPRLSRPFQRRRDAVAEAWRLLKGTAGRLLDTQRGVLAEQPFRWRLRLRRPLTAEERPVFARGRSGERKLVRALVAWAGLPTQDARRTVRELVACGETLCALTQTEIRHAWTPPALPPATAEAWALVEASPLDPLPSLLRPSEALVTHTPPLSNAGDPMLTLGQRLYEAARVAWPSITVAWSALRPELREPYEQVATAFLAAVVCPVPGRLGHEPAVANGTICRHCSCRLPPLEPIHECPARWRAEAQRQAVRTVPAPADREALAKRARLIYWGNHAADLPWEEASEGERDGWLAVVDALAPHLSPDHGDPSQLIRDALDGTLAEDWRNGQPDDVRKLVEEVIELDRLRDSFRTDSQTFHAEASEARDEVQRLRVALHDTRELDGKRILGLTRQIAAHEATIANRDATIATLSRQQPRPPGPLGRLVRALRNPTRIER